MWQEIRDQGFSRKIRTLYRFIRTLRQGPVELPAPSVLDRVSVQEALWLLVRPLDALRADERANQQELCQASQELERLHTLVQSFGQIVGKREGHRLEAWMKQVTDSGLVDVQRFAKRLERDKAVVLAGLTLVYSNGQVEGRLTSSNCSKEPCMAGQNFLCSASGLSMPSSIKGVFEEEVLLLMDGSQRAMSLRRSPPSFSPQLTPVDMPRRSRNKLIL